MTGEGSQNLTISVAAGKGGTGKTLIATSLAQALVGSARVQVLDCDVEEPNADILLRPEIASREQVDILVPEVNADRCIHCGKCAQVCQVSAIAVIRTAVLTFHDLCSGCGACALACPTGAITEVPMRVGEVATGQTGEGIQFVGGRLEVGHQRSGPVTKAVKRRVARSERRRSRETAERSPEHGGGVAEGRTAADMINIIDAPPGTACPMQEAVADSDFCILVTEPTPFGLANLREAVETCRRLEVPCGVIINRERGGWDEMDDYLTGERIEVLLRVPERREIAEAYSRGETLVDADGHWRDELISVYERITELAATQPVS